MLCIDQLIHAFRISLQTGKFNRSFAKNLIEGSHDQAIEFLDRLSVRTDGVDKEQWRECEEHVQDAARAGLSQQDNY